MVFFLRRKNRTSPIDEIRKKLINALGLEDKNVNVGELVSPSNKKIIMVTIGLGNDLPNKTTKSLCISNIIKCIVVIKNIKEIKEYDKVAFHIRWLKGISDSFVICSAGADVKQILQLKKINNEKFDSLIENFQWKLRADFFERFNINSDVCADRGADRGQGT